MMRKALLYAVALSTSCSHAFTNLPIKRAFSVEVRVDVDSPCFRPDARTYWMPAELFSALFAMTLPRYNEDCSVHG
jgi:hypothetical protein